MRVSSTMLREAGVQIARRADVMSALLSFENVDVRHEIDARGEN